MYKMVNAAKFRRIKGREDISAAWSVQFRFTHNSSPGQLSLYSCFLMLPFVGVCGKTQLTVSSLIDLTRTRRQGKQKQVFLYVTLSTSYSLHEAFFLSSVFSVHCERLLKSSLHVQLLPQNTANTSVSLTAAVWLTHIITFLH